MATTNGTLTERVSSTVSSPAVHYSAAYTATRAGNSNRSMSVKLSFEAWLNASSSALGAGIQLTVFARIDGGPWQSVVLKNGAAVWGGTDRHSASLTLTVSSTESAAAVEWYVSRDGSAYSGLAGTLASATRPLSGSAELPVYTAAQTGNASVSPSASAGAEAVGVVYLRVGGVWKPAVPYVKADGVWKHAAPYVRTGGVWKAT